MEGWYTAHVTHQKVWDKNNVRERWKSDTNTGVSALCCGINCYTSFGIFWWFDPLRFRALEWIRRRCDPLGGRPAHKLRRIASATDWFVLPLVWSACVGESTGLDTRPFWSYGPILDFTPPRRRRHQRRTNRESPCRVDHRMHDAPRINRLLSMKNFWWYGVLKITFGILRVIQSALKFGIYKTTSALNWYIIESILTLAIAIGLTATSLGSLMTE